MAVARASDADRKRLEREAAQAYAVARLEEVEEMNADLAATYAELDQILTATLAVDDFVDLEKLRVKVEHPPFDHPELLWPGTAPAPIVAPPEPMLQAPTPVGGLLGRKKKEAEAAQAAQQLYASAHQAWREQIAAIPQREAEQAVAFHTREQIRTARLEREQAKYAEQKKVREDEAAAQNVELDELINGLAYGVVEAVQEYVGIVAANSIYPELLPVSQTSTFDPGNAELTMRVLIPGPETIPTVKAYRYVKASDEIVPTAATQKDVRDRYAGILHNVALRSLHEVFEADRRRLIRAVSLEVGSEALNTATGRLGYVPLLAVAATRETFEGIDLSAVVPVATLEHLGATVSKNPQALTPVTLKGIRKA